MDTFPGEHDESDGKLGLASVSFMVGVGFGVVVALYMQRGDDVANKNLSMTLDIARSELRTEQLERKVFSDGLAGCYERLGQKDRGK